MNNAAMYQFSHGHTFSLLLGVIPGVELLGCANFLFNILRGEKKHFEELPDLSIEAVPLYIPSNV